MLMRSMRALSMTATVSIMAPPIVRTFISTSRAEIRPAG
jgi:hypothetical protein